MTNKLDLAHYSVECPYCSNEIELEEDKHLALNSIVCSYCNKKFDVLFECNITTLIIEDTEAIRETEESLISEEINTIAKRYI
jgi:transposase-like protein